MSLSLEGGVGARLHQLADGQGQTGFSLLAKSTFYYKISAARAIQNEARVIFDADRVHFENSVDLIANLIGNLSGHLEFKVRYESDAPALTKRLDTITKLSLVFVF
jgi:putative salt-induced outer membrane protein YdiY